MTYLNIDSYSDLKDSMVIETAHKNKYGNIVKYENGKFFVQYESAESLEEYTAEDIKNKKIVFQDKEIGNAVLLKICMDELKGINSPLYNNAFNNYGEPGWYVSNSEKKTILEQWRVTVETAMHVSSRRQSINNIFITLLTILISGVLFSDGIFDTSKSFQLKVSIIVAILGILICVEWIIQMKHYGELNDFKYSAVREMEKYLPIAVFTAEDIYYFSNIGNERSFSKREGRIPRYFIIAFVGIALIASISLIKSNSCNNKESSNITVTTDTTEQSNATVDNAMSSATDATVTAEDVSSAAITVGQ